MYMVTVSLNGNIRRHLVLLVSHLVLVILNLWNAIYRHRYELDAIRNKICGNFLC